jgi:hypothetical protein
MYGRTVASSICALTASSERSVAKLTENKQLSFLPIDRGSMISNGDGCFDKQAIPTISYVLLQEHKQAVQMNIKRGKAGWRISPLNRRIVGMLALTGGFLDSCSSTLL